MAQHHLTVNKRNSHCMDALLSFTLGHVTHTRFSARAVVKDSLDFFFFFFRRQSRGANVSPDAGMNVAFFERFVAKYG